MTLLASFLDSRCRIWFSRCDIFSLSILFSPSRPICPSLSFCKSALSDALIRSCSCSSPWSWPICPLKAASAWISKCITEFQKKGTFWSCKHHSVKCWRSSGNSLLHIVTCYKLLDSQVLLTQYKVKITGGEIQTLRRVTHAHPAVNHSQVQLAALGLETSISLGPLTSTWLTTNLQQLLTWTKL